MAKVRTFMPCTLIVYVQNVKQFSYLDIKFIIEAFKAWQLAFSAWKEAVWCLEVGFLCLVHYMYM